MPPPSVAHFAPSDWLLEIQRAVRTARDALRRIGADEMDPAYALAFRMLRRIEELAAQARWRLDSGQAVADDELALIEGLFTESSAFLLSP